MSSKMAVTYDIKSLGLTCFYELKEADVPEEAEAADEATETEEAAEGAEEAETAEDAEK